MRWLFLCITSLLLALCPNALSAPLAKDTALLSAHLKSLHGKQWLNNEEFTKLQTEYLAWIDSRVKVGVSVDSMNRELRQAGLFVRWPKPEDSNWLDERYKSHAGLLDPIFEKPVRNERDFLVIAAGILKGAGCSNDVTAIIYERQPLRRLGYLNGDPGDPEFAFYLSGLDISPQNSSGQRIVATGWVTSNCTSSWNGKRIRVDRFGGPTVEKVLGRSLAAKDRHEGENVAARINDDFATFFYDGPTGDSDLLSRPAIARYRIAGEHAVRVSPVALTRAGFIYEWLHMEEGDAARWSEPGARTERNSVRSVLEASIFNWERIAQCGGSPPIWEIAVRPLGAKSPVVFRMSGARATQLRMLAIERTITPSCSPEDLSKGLTSVAAELPW